MWIPVIISAMKANLFSNSSKESEKNLNRRVNSQNIVVFPMREVNSLSLAVKSFNTVVGAVAYS